MKGMACVHPPPGAEGFTASFDTRGLSSGRHLLAMKPVVKSAVPTKQSETVVEIPRNT